MLFIVSFLFFLLQNWRTGGRNKIFLAGKAGTSGRGEVMGKGIRRMNMVKKMCTHVCKCKMIPVETTPGIWGGSEIMYNVFDTL
jgi:hypothetical protein